MREVYYFKIKSSIRKLKGALCFSALLLCYLLSYTQQNLVPNASFEAYTICPGNQGGLFLAYPWYSPTMNTPDYFHQCNNSINGQAGVPCNWVGCQNARTGVAYAGWGNHFGTPNAREYISVRLSDSLKSGKKYCVEFFVSRAGRGLGAIDRVGAHLSKDSIFQAHIYVLPFQPQIEHPQGNIIYDSTNWVLISGQYTAQGGEKFITIGNFYPDSLTSVDSLGSSSGIGVYFYVDDVKVWCCGADSCIITPPPPPPPTPIENFFIPTAFSPNDDGNNDVLHVRGPVKEMDLYIYNRWGELIFHGTDPSKGWDGTYKGELLNAGVFVYYFRGTLLDGTEISQKGNVTLVR
jgi:gliding motility-associated-like protein